LLKKEKPEESTDGSDSKSNDWPRSII
jgi:hypothetical protein